jgi:hypothetical protein
MARLRKSKSLLTDYHLCLLYVRAVTVRLRCAMQRSKDSLTQLRLAARAHHSALQPVRYCRLSGRSTARYPQVGWMYGEGLECA